VLLCLSNSFEREARDCSEIHIGSGRKGGYCFSAEEAVGALGANAVATRAALRRLRQKGELAMPYKGFHVVVPPEFRNIGCLPAGHFIPSLMAHLEEKYYAGLLYYFNSAPNRHPKPTLTTERV
jgi:hypothetical protein